MGDIILEKQLACSEDLLIGVGSSVQNRNSSPVTVTKINASKLMGILVVQTENELSGLDVSNLGEVKVVYVSDTNTLYSFVEGSWKSSTTSNKIVKDTSAVDNIVSLSNTAATISDGSYVLFKPNYLNTGSTTIEVGGSAAKELKYKNQTLSSGFLNPEKLYIAYYDASNDVFQCELVGTEIIEDSGVIKTVGGSDITVSNANFLNGYSADDFVKTSESSSYSSATYPVACYDAYPLYSTTDFLPEDLNKSSFISGADAHSGTLIADSTDGYFKLVLPYMVVIGDSIAEGHPALHGRLDPNGSASYDPTYASQPGQLSYEFSHMYNIPVLNQGIGGQTTTQVRARWSRDVLAASNDIGDGRGATTLEFNGIKPFAVYLHCGINDVFLGDTAATIKDNIEFFAQSCKDNNIKLILANIGADSNFDSTKEAVAVDVNNWLSTSFKQNHPEVVVIDYLNWSSDGTNDYNTLRSGEYADSVHPNKTGYQNYAKYVQSKVSLPLALDSIRLNCTLDSANTLGQFEMVSKFTLNASSYTLPLNSVVDIGLYQLVNTDTPIIRLDVNGTQPITGSAYTGFASIEATLKTSIGSATTPIFPSSSSSSGSSSGSNITAAGVFIGGALNSSWKSFGITNVDTSNTSSTGVITLTLSTPATHFYVGMVGDGNNVYNYHPTWSSGDATSGVTTVNINLFKISDGTQVTDLTYHNYSFLAYSL